MHIGLKRLTAGVATSAAIAFGAAAPAQAAPVVTGGLVNVTIVDTVDISRVTVQLPIAVAANVCDVDVNVLTADLADDGQANCTATATSRARR